MREQPQVLLCCSENSLTSWWVDNEIDKAFAKEQQLMKERKKKVLALIPLDLDGYLLNVWTNGKRSQVLTRLAADFEGGKAVTQNLRRRWKTLFAPFALMNSLANDRRNQSFDSLCTNQELCTGATGRTVLQKG